MNSPYNSGSSALEDRKTEHKSLMQFLLEWIVVFRKMRCIPLHNLAITKYIRIFLNANTFMLHLQSPV